LVGSERARRTLVRKCLVGYGLIPIALQDGVTVDRRHDAVNYIAPISQDGGHAHRKNQR
jgi:hypothetical protein